MDRNLSPAGGLRNWLGSYRKDDGRWYSIIMPAETAEGAEQALQEIYAECRIDGEAFGIIEARP